jgi:hypothetical protein
MDCREEFEKLVSSLCLNGERKEDALVIWEKCWNLRQESKPITALGLEKVWHNAETANFGPPWIGSKVREVICQAIHAALPSTSRDNAMNREIDRQLNKYIELEVKLCQEDRGFEETIQSLKSELTRKNDQIKRLRYALRIYGDDQNEKYIEDLLAEIGED